LALSSSSYSSSSLLTFALGIVGRLVIIIIICELVCCRRCAVFATKTKRWIKALMMGSRRQKAVKVKVEVGDYSLIDRFDGLIAGED
jgi:hypothetical protein